jgi:membrane protein YqaA with SNARE-associated domain
VLDFFLSWWGAILLGALDSSPFFFAPLAIDALLVYLVARHREMFWVYPLLTTAGSVAGAMFTYWIGRQIGDAGLAKLVPQQRLKRLKARVKETGAVAMALPAVLPPPFPLSALVMTCGALEVSRRRFFSVFAVMRAARFGVEALLAHRYGEQLLRVLQSPPFRRVVIGFIVFAAVGTVISAVRVWRGTRRLR